MQPSVHDSKAAARRQCSYWFMASNQWKEGLQDRHRLHGCARDAQPHWQEGRLHGRATGAFKGRQAASPAPHLRVCHPILLPHTLRPEAAGPACSTGRGESHGVAGIPGIFRHLPGRNSEGARNEGLPGGLRRTTGQPLPALAPGPVPWPARLRRVCPPTYPGSPILCPCLQPLQGLPPATSLMDGARH
jgi:hypothetical protein